MKRTIAFAWGGMLAVLLLSSFMVAQVRRGNVIIPSSSIARPGDAGIRAHTNFIIYSPEGVIPDTSTPTGERPASLGCIYGLVSNPLSGCPKGTSVSNPTGGRGIIAIVDAFDNPSAAADLATFSSTFGLPAANFHTVFANGRPSQDCGWNEEESLDVQWAHAMAPSAVIILVEARTNSTTDLIAAVDKANQLIQAHGGRGEVTMSWQSGEFNGEQSYESHFAQSGVVYFASSGDSGGVVGWPSVSPSIVSAGGTTVLRDGSGNFTGEKGWSGSGGGNSTFFSRPSFQDGIQNIVGTHRGTPDFSFDADPFSGVSVYISSPACGSPLKWQVFGGTSVSSPALAGVVNSAGHFSSSSSAENTLIYSGLGNSALFTDITTGQAGSHMAGPGWDYVTGVGTDVGKTGK